MSKRILRNLTQAISHYAKKIVLPMGLAMLMIAPNCVYAYDTEVNEWKNVQIVGGGMITGVEFSEAEKDLIYARTDMGGIYRWQPETETWKPLTDWVGPEYWSNLGCDDLATDPNDPNRVYALMGEYDNGWTDVKGAVFCSDDKGETWTVSELPFFCGSNMQGRQMNAKLVVDPNNSAVLYLGSRNDGLWKSEDYGITWNKIEEFNVEGDFYYNKGDAYGGHLGITFIICDKNSNVEGKGSQTLYVGIGNQEHSIYKTTDGGKTWAPLAGEPRGKLVDEAAQKWEIQEGDTYLPYQAHLTKDGILYVTYTTEAGPYISGYGDVWKYNTNTEKWKLISPKSSKTAPDDPWYGYQGLTVDAQDENTLMVICQSWWPDLFMYRSKDGGETWENVWEWTSYPNRDVKCEMDITDAPWLDWGSTHAPDDNATASPKIGWTVGAIAIDPFNSDRMMYGTGATLYGTDNLTNWDKGEIFKIQVKAKGIEEVVSNALITLPNSEDDGLISSLFDVNGFYHEDVTKVPKLMANVTPGDKYSTLNSSVDVDYAELNTDIVVRVGERTAIDSYGGYLNGMMWSKDGGKTFAPIHSRIGQSNGKGEVALAADGSVVVWATPDEPVSYSKGGYNWTASEGIPTGANVCSDRVNPKVFYGYSQGKMYVSTDAAKTFTEATLTGEPGIGATSDNSTIKAVRGYEGHVWYGTAKGNGERGLWHSEDQGKTFTKIENVDEALSFGFGKAKEEGGYPAIYIAGKVEGQNGFFRSDDKGETWTRINDDQHQYGLVDPCCDVTGDYDVYGRVYVGTNGRGIVYADTGSGVVAVPNATLSKTSATFDKKEDLQKDVTVTVNANGNTLEAVEVGDKLLVEGEDYTVDGDKVTILKAFLAKQENGMVKVNFDFNAGKDPVLTINVTKTMVNSSLAATTAIFDKAEAKDVTVGVELKGNTLTAVKNNDAVLTEGVDYTVVDDVVCFSAAYLETLERGTHEFTFIFNEGQNASFVINVVNTAEKDSVVTPNEIAFDKNVENQAAVVVNVSLNGNTLQEIRCGDKVLKAGTDYIVGEDDTVTFPADYLASLSKGTYDFTFVFSAGAKQMIKVVVDDTTVVKPVEGAIKLDLVTKGEGKANAIVNTFRLSVADDSKFDLSKLAIRYYFANEDAKVGATCWIDTASLQYTTSPWYVSINGNTTGKVENMSEPTDTANQYIEITFGEVGVLDHTGVLQVDARTSNNNWSAFDQSNDFSYGDASKVAVFYDGELISGSIPQ